MGYSMDSNRDDATIRVTNLSENTQESDLRQLFSPFGSLNRVYLAKDRVTEQARVCYDNAWVGGLVLGRVGQGQ